MKKLMEKIKLKNTVTMQQEKLLGEKTQMLQKEQQELAEVQQALRHKEEEVINLSSLQFPKIFEFWCIVLGKGENLF